MRLNELNTLVKNFIQEYTGIGASGGNSTDGNDITSPRPFPDDKSEIRNYINKNVSPTSFGLDSSWDRLYKLNTDMIFLGCNLSVCTFVRYIENRFGVTYLYNKYFSTPIKKNGKIISNYSSSLLRYRQIEIQYELKFFESHLLKKKLLRKTSNKNFNDCTPPFLSA